MDITYKGQVPFCAPVEEVIERVRFGTIFTTKLGVKCISEVDRTDVYICSSLVGCRPNIVEATNLTNGRIISITFGTRVTRLEGMVTYGFMTPK